MCKRDSELQEMIKLVNYISKNDDKLREELIQTHRRKERLPG
jgi:hypothetical protein